MKNLLLTQYNTIQVILSKMLKLSAFICEALMDKDECKSVPITLLLIKLHHFSLAFLPSKLEARVRL